MIKKNEFVTANVTFWRSNYKKKGKYKAGKYIR